MEFITVQITGDCNLECGFCLDEYKGQHYMNESTFNSVLDFIDNNNIKRVYITGGEPTLHSKFNNIIEKLFSRGIFIILNTNGTVIVDELVLNKINKVMVSVDSNDDMCLRGKEHFNKATEFYKNYKNNLEIVTVVTKKNINNLKILGEKLPKTASWRLMKFVNINCQTAEQYEISNKEFEKKGLKLKKYFQNKNITLIGENEFKSDYIHITPKGDIATYKKGERDSMVKLKDETKR